MVLLNTLSSRALCPSMLWYQCWCPQSSLSLNEVLCGGQGTCSAFRSLPLCTMVGSGVPASSSALSLPLLLCFSVIFGSLNYFRYLKPSPTSLKCWGWTEPSGGAGESSRCRTKPLLLEGLWFEVSVLSSLLRAPCTCGLTCSQTMSLHHRLSTSSHGCLSGNTHGMGLVTCGRDAPQSPAQAVLAWCAATLLQLCHRVLSWVHQPGVSELQLINVCEGQG